MTIRGAILVGGEERQREAKFHATNPATGKRVGPDYSEASSQDVADACALANAAAEHFGALAPADRSQFLETVAAAILAIGDVLIETAIAETGLPQRRLEGERTRTIGQLQMFADEVREGLWLDATIDPALPHRAPPRPDLRRVNVPLGPVAVFGASNFPLAFSVAGGDTASAFAAGCPVVAKGHPAHPGTGELVARAILNAVSDCGLPQGVFSFLPGCENILGAALVSDPRIMGVGFTGSRAGGLALMDIARRRLVPIPVFAEMSSVNPVVLLPGALAIGAEALGAGLVGSLTLGAGQFCTNPGLILAIDTPDLNRFIKSAVETIASTEPGVMLTGPIRASYVEGVAALDAHAHTARLAAGVTLGDARCSPALFETSAAALLNDRSLQTEVFGASAIIVRCADDLELAEALNALEGQLTATLHFEAQDDAIAARLMPLLAAKAGRVLANGWPTGVEVSAAMVHGGPFPATSDGRTTSVGTLAMARFLRPICYQDIKDVLLPPPLRQDNPWRIPRRVDGIWETPQ